MKINITIEEIELIFARLIQRVKNDGIKFVDIRPPAWMLGRCASSKWSIANTSKYMAQME